MPNMHDRMFQGATWGAHQRGFGQSATLTPDGGAPVTVTGVWEPGRVVDGFYQDGKIGEGRGVFAVAPFDGWTPSTQDAVTIDGTAYAVETIGQLTPVVELQLVTFDPKRIGGDSTYRRR